MGVLSLFSVTHFGEKKEWS